MRRICQILIKFSFFLSFFISLDALSVSQAQINQFKKMPKSQQMMLAKQMGVNPSTLAGMAGKGGTSSGGVTPNLAPKLVKKPLKTSQRVHEKATGYVDESGQFFPIEEKEDVLSELKPFGYDVFEYAPTTFNPVDNIAIPEGYIVGVGDEISVQVFGKDNDEYLLSVTREGNVIIPHLGPIQVSGLSFVDMKNLIVSQIKKRIIGVDAVVSLSQLKSIRIFVLGAAYKPGPYTMSSLTSITHALFAAGGVSNIGSLRNIELKRAGKLIQSFDFYDLLLKGDSSKDVLLKNGDVVFVNTLGATASVAGKVMRPAIYELAEGETFKDLLSMAGGALPKAHEEQVSVERFAGELRSIVNLDLTSSKQLNKPVKNGDYLTVMAKSQAYHKAVTLIGAVTRPGKYEWQPNDKISNIIQSIDTGLLSHADLTYSLLVREIDLAKNIEVHQFSLANALFDVNSVDNLSIQPRDKIIIFSKVDNILEEKITLDNLAYTQDELLGKQKQLAKEKFEEDTFWKKYQTSRRSPAIREDATEDGATDKLLKGSISGLPNNYSKPRLNYYQQSLFSRQKLLGPINNKLIAQSSSGGKLQLVEIEGQVKYPGTYPLAVNGKVTDLVIAAGGIVESAYLPKVDLTRSENGSLKASKKHVAINLKSALSGNEDENIELQSRDRLYIHKIPAWSQNQTIRLAGEFVFPGTYVFQRGETLTDVIKRAGGLTEFAHIEGSVFSRARLKALERQNIAKLTEDMRIELASKSLTEDNTILYSESQKLIQDLTRIRPVGRLVIELEKVLNDDDYEILIEGGDTLYVPAFKNSVNVIGHVQVTSSHVYQSSMTVEDYIATSGGMKKRADDDRIYVIAANGSIKVLDNNGWFSDVNTSVQPGDTIVVPLDSDYTNSLDLWSTISTMIYGSAVAVAAVNGL